MNEKDLYERQYQGALVNETSWHTLRRVLRRFDLHREDVAKEMIGAGGRLVDLGCGDGSFLLKVKSRWREVHGVDISPTRLEQARKRLGPHAAVHFTAANLNSTRLELPDATFDAATSIAVIEHLFDPYSFVAEVRRILRPGGIFVAQVPNIAYIKYRLQLALGRLPVTSSPHNWREIGWDGGHLHYFTQHTFCRLLEESGFEVLQVAGSGLLGRLRNFYPALLTGDICVKARKPCSM